MDYGSRKLFGRTRGDERLGRIDGKSVEVGGILTPSSLLEELRVHFRCILDMRKLLCSFVLDRRRGSRFEYGFRPEG